MLGGMLSKAELFCGEMPAAIREETTEYFTDSDN
jgi:hypothetical protein